MTKTRTKELPSQEQIANYFDYDPDNGRLTRKFGISGQNKGNSAGWVTDKGYIKVRMDWQVYYAHRLIWKLISGRDPEELDHINGNRADNRFCNLREASMSQNALNRGLNKNSLSGIKGVCYNPTKNRWIAQCQINKKKIQVGAFLTKEEAANAMLIFREKHFAEFTNHG